MSRIGKNPIEVPKGVDVKVSGISVNVKGPKGNLALVVNEAIKVAVDGGFVTLTRRSDSGGDKALHGLYRSLIANMVHGVTEGFSKKLEIVGVGYKADVSGDNLNLILGFSHPINYTLPKGISAKVDKQTSIEISGADKQLVGQVAADVRSMRPPEPYKGKGIKYIDEIVRRKAGKAGKGAGA
jgi:large subunit ribosomal protein L6